MAFEGFSNAGLHLLARLPNLSKAEFDDSKDNWNRLMLNPAKQFVEEIGSELRAAVSASVQAIPKVNGSISPIHRDLRFADDKHTLYKDFLLLNFWDGPNKKSAPTLRIRLSANGISFATGIVLSPSGLSKWRHALDQQITGDAYATLVTDASSWLAASVTEPELKNVPTPYDADHPRGTLLRHKSFQLRWQQPVPKQLDSADFVDWCVEQLVQIKPIQLWLKEHCQ